MLDRFPAEHLRHAAMGRKSGTAAWDVIDKDRFAEAIAEITLWPGHAPTPLHSLRNLANQAGVGQLLYKDEAPRFGLKSFKALGGAFAAQKVLARELTNRSGKSVSLSDIRSGKFSQEIAEITLVSATDGNHGRSLAWRCQQLGVPCRIYLHAEVSHGREQSIADLGATIIRIKGDYDESVRLARKDAEENGWLVVSDTSWEGYTEVPKDVMAGYAVMANEICEELSAPPTHVFLQAGVGGLAASVAAYFRQYWQEKSPRVIVVEPALAACLYQSVLAGQATIVPIEDETIMAGLSCGEPSPIAWEILHEEASDFVTIPEEVVAPAMQILAKPIGDDPAIVAGESAVAGLSALLMACNSPEMREILHLNENARILVIGSEGNTDPEAYERLIAEDAFA